MRLISSVNESTVEGGILIFIRSDEHGGSLDFLEQLCAPHCVWARSDVRTL